MNWFNNLLDSFQKRPSIEDVGTLTDDLRKMLSGHDLKNIAIHDDWLLIDGDLPGLRVDYCITDRRPDRYTVCVDFKLALREGRHIIESYGDMGSDFRHACGKNLFKFCAGALHVFLAAYWDHHEPDQVDIEHWEADGVEWQAYLSSLINTTSEGQKAGIPEDYMTRLQQVICSLPLSESEHWISMFFFNLKNDWTAEVRLDNEVHPDLTAAVKGMSWPEAEGFYSQRQFILLKRADIPHKV